MKGRERHTWWTGEAVSRCRGPRETRSGPQDPLQGVLDLCPQPGCFRPQGPSTPGAILGA